MDDLTEWKTSQSPQCSLYFSRHAQYWEQHPASWLWRPGKSAEGVNAEPKKLKLSISEKLIPEFLGYYFHHSKQ